MVLSGVHVLFKNDFTYNPLYFDLDTAAKFVIMIIYLSRNVRLRGNNLSQTMKDYCILYFKEKCVVVFVRIASLVRRFK